MSKSESAEDLDEPVEDKRPRTFVSLESRFKNNGDRLPKMLSTSNENVSKLAQTIGSFGLRKRKQSSERTSSSEGGGGSARSTPGGSTASTPRHVPGAKRPLDKTISEDAAPGEAETEPLTECYVGPPRDLGSVVQFEDEHSFTLRPTDRYLNVNVWGRNAQGEDLLLGYANIPLLHVLNECCNSMLGHYISSFSFLPPDNVPPTR